MYTKAILKSLATYDSSINTIDSILSWVKEKNLTTNVKIKETNYSDCTDWYFDVSSGTIHNKKNSFFYITGIKENDIQQPIIVQDEIGYLGMIAKIIDGVLHVLIQAKIEPGNINCIQLSPTIQATRSNFMQLHGGRQPAYLEYFKNAEKYQIIVDQIQSEQSSRFYKKRNRNIVVLVDEEIEIFDNFRFVTLGQLKKLLKIDNLVNMDTRTVLSCLPIRPDTQDKYLFKNEPLYNSMLVTSNAKEMYHTINDYKMYSNYNSDICSLNELNEWEFDSCGGRRKNGYFFDVIYCDIEIDGREVRNWMQPLCRAKGMATFALFKYISNNTEYYIVQVKHEIGTFDVVELAPTIQAEANMLSEYSTLAIDLFEKGKKCYDVILSEEGGRFYHEQNRNCIIEISEDEAEQLLLEDNRYYACTYRTLNDLVQTNNVLNIQLRNLLSLMEI